MKMRDLVVPNYNAVSASLILEQKSTDHCKNFSQFSIYSLVGGVA